MINSIRTRMILAIGLPLLAVYLGMAAVEYRLGKKEALDRMGDYLRVVTSGRACNVNERFSSTGQIVRTTMNLLAVEEPPSEKKIVDILQQNLSKNPGIFGMALAYDDGQYQPGRKLFAPYVCRDSSGKSLRTTMISPETGGYDYLQSDWFAVPKRLNKPLWGEPYFDKGAGNVMMCTYSVPFYRNGRFMGVATADASLEKIRQELSKIEIDGGYCSIVSAVGTFISHPDESRVMKQSLFSLAKKYNDPELEKLGREIVSGKQGTRRVFDHQAREYIWLAYAPIRTTGWALLAVMQEDEVMAPVYHRLLRELIILIAGLVVILGIIVFVSVHITRPIARLTRMTKELAGGNLDVRVEGISGHDEIALLAGTFNKMVVDLKANVEARIREESARKSVESELKVARVIQASLLPRIFPPFPDRREFTLHAVNEPAKFMAGDFFDFFFINDDTLAVVMADVSGKGVPAAMFMAVTRTAIRSFTVPGKTPAEILKHVNDVMVRDNDNMMFVTVFFGFYNIRTGDLTFTNAGHNPPYVLRRSGTFDTLMPTGPILSVLEDAKYTSDRTSLNPGESLVLFTDGVTESDRDGELYGEQRFEKLLLSIADRPVEKICQNVIDAVVDYGGKELRDDVTVLSLRRTE
jgi:sigma-B regulation protein RsbU (phosphoserine phosphatase)